MRIHAAAARLASALVGIGLTAIAARALDDGDLDPSFGDQGSAFRVVQPSSVTFQVQGLDVARDGAIAISGDLQFGTTNATDFAVCFFYPTSGCGSYDFHLGGSNDDENVGGIAYLPDGKYVLAGIAAGPAADPPDRAALVEYDASNVVNTGFGNQGQLTVDFAGEAQIDAVESRGNGDIVFAGYFDHGAQAPGTGDDCLVGRVSESGAPDPGFGSSGLATVGFDQGDSNDDACVAVTTDVEGRVVVAGAATRADGSTDFAIARLTGAGQLDTSFAGGGKRVLPFDQGGGNDDFATAVAVDRADRIVAAGLVDTAGGQQVGVVRLLPDGNLDDSFNGTGMRTFSISAAGDDVTDVRAMRILSPLSNDIVIAGTYAPVLNATKTFIAVLHDDGSFDVSFSGDGKQHIDVPNLEPVNYAGGLALWGGEILVGGGFSSFGQDRDKGWVTRLFMHQISGDDFESGDFRFWSSHLP